MRVLVAVALAVGLAGPACVAGRQPPSSVEMDDGTAALEVEPFDPLAGVVFTAVVPGGKSRRVPRPDVSYFRGQVHGDPTSHVFVAVDAKGARGFVAQHGAVRVFGTYPDGKIRGNRLMAKRPFACGVVGNGPAHPPVPKFHAEATTRTGMLVADLAVETDHELWVKFGSDAATATYISDLMAAVDSIYERDVQVQLHPRVVHLWPGVDPWTATVIGNALTEVQAWWANPANPDTTTPHAAVHFVSGKGLGGGIAWVDVLCGPYSVGVSGVNGAFNLADPSRVWDVLVVAHELGHNFSSPHTHCYSPPVDECYNKESGCYAGPINCTRGTVMSYCHLYCGGLPDIDLLFGPVVAPKVRGGAELAPCLTLAVSTTTSTTQVGPTTTTTTSGPTTSTTAPPACKGQYAPCTGNAECCSQHCADRPKRGGWVCVRRQ